MTLTVREKKKIECMSCAIPRDSGIRMYANHNGFLLCHLCKKSLAEIEVSQ